MRRIARRSAPLPRAGTMPAGDLGVLGVRIVERQAERVREVDRQEARRQLARPARPCRSACAAKLVALSLEMVEKPWSEVRITSVVPSRPCSFSAARSLREIVVGVPDGGERGRAVDAGHQPAEAVALVVLRAVGIARPEHQQERLAALLEQRQHDLGRRRRRDRPAAPRWRPSCRASCCCRTCRCRRAPASAAGSPAAARRLADRRRTAGCRPGGRSRRRR